MPMRHPNSPPSRNYLSASRIALGTALMLAVAAAWIKIDPRVVFLSPTSGAIWIRSGVAFDLTAKFDGARAVFRTRFEAPRAAAAAAVTLGVLRTAELRLDGRLVESVGLERRAWKRPVRVELGPLTAGAHELEISVANPAGPAAVKAYAADPMISSGERWEVLSASGTWVAARAIDRAWDVPFSRLFPRGDQALLRVLPALAPIFFVVFLAAMGVVRLGRLAPSPAALRWVLLAVWTVLGLNNIRRLPMYVGYDVLEHLRYLETIAIRHRLPAATAGLQTFQAPLYYLLSAPLWTAFASRFGYHVARFWIRLLPLFCGALQIETAYRCARTVFPSRRDLQRLTILVAGSMPMNIYISQVAGNEPLAGCLCAAVVAGALSFRPGARERRDLGIIAATLGLALLAKASSFLLVAPVALLLGVRLAGAKGGRARAAKGLALAAAVALSVCGWYYFENLIRFNSLFPNMFAAGLSWWQEPGYRSAAQFIRFGAALLRPVYSGVNGFWDSLYSTLWMDGYLSGLVGPGCPPWNYAFMAASGILALIPSAGIAVGLLRVFIGKRSEERRGLSFAAGCVVLYAAAILIVYLRLPIYSTGKASYMLGVTPCLALLAASGLDALSSIRAVRAALYGFLTCWAVAVYAAYFVVGPVIVVAAR